MSTLLKKFNNAAIPTAQSNQIKGGFIPVTPISEPVVEPVVPISEPVVISAPISSGCTPKPSYCGSYGGGGSRHHRSGGGCRR